jgi:hypothetical protein
MGVVYLARVEGDHTADLIVVKQLKTDLAQDPEFRQMLIEEARLAARLTHPNVVRTIDAGFDGRHHYIAMELLDGQPLDAILRAPARALPLPLAVRVLEEALAGLHAAHELRDADGTPLDVVHRDVSPHNVMVTYDGDVKVLDFGIAKAADSSQRTRTGVIKGKATYMAPEQAARGRVDRRADVFAVGVMVWEIVAHERFWGDLSEQEIFARLQRGETERAMAHAPDAPPALVAVIARATAADAAARYATADEMRLALAAWSRDAGAPSHEELGRFVSDAFATERAQLASEIAAVADGDASIEAPDEDEVPVRGFSRTYALRLGSEGGTPPPQTSGALATRGTRRRRLGWVAVAGLAIGGTVAASFAMRTRATTAVPTAASSAPRVALDSIDCIVHAQPDEIANDATIWIGTLFPLTGPNAALYGIASSNAAELARRDFAEVAHGLPSDGGARRPIGIIACDGAADFARALRHLVDDVHVPAILGLRESGTEIGASSLFLDQRARVRAPLAIVLHDLLEPKLRAPPARLRDGEPMKVATLRPSTMPALESNDSTTHDFVYADPISAPTPPDYAAFVAEVASFAPDVVVFLGRSAVKAIVEPLHAAWKAGRPQPYFISVAPPTATPPTARFVLRYNEAFSPKVTRATSPALPYDSFYLLAYAAVAAGDAPITAASLTRGMERLVGPGRSLEVGASAIFEALDALEQGRTIDLVGASGPLRFDPATGEAAQSFVVLCVATDAQGKALDAIESGVVFDAKTSRLQGTFNCR